ncbi:hypothetical protein [Planctomicrobium piriforme]|uniref:Uncharacterized protein n=1 Tax=Planctomicrobium piriforme TaxID=1576369 RepID=A0A1I3BEZ5_9PLAN|nr:hypothetical protein [Planctomicrobium piriforme]SFH60291.1 hypothetical protein SAMN05421753_101392 [Planctomicrobium piriforme]
MASMRAPAVAEVLWELKRLDKVAKFTAIAERAGFSAGSNGRAMQTCLETIRKEWPHLQAWRAIRDDGTIEKDSPHKAELIAWGATLTADDASGRMNVLIDEARVMIWEDLPAAGRAAKTTA